MRPVRLVVSAMGPYIGPLTLDFRQLGSNRLFLLNGPTGSGKTMLLDAMSFALFGETTGQWRSPKSLRSQHAPPTLRTEVTFDFALGAEHYRVYRQPEQERPRQRGSGMTIEKSKAVLWRRTSLEDDSEAGQALAEGPADVTARVIEILGFTADQFRNVTVLPQGEFQKFLNAKSEEREQILEVLFQTGRYRLIQETLKDREKQAKGSVEQQQLMRRAVLQQAQCESEQHIIDRRAALEPQRTEQVERIGQLRVALKTTETALSAGRDADRLLSETRAAEAAYDTLREQQPTFNAKETELANARRATPLQPLESDLKNREGEARAAAADLISQQQAVASSEIGEAQAQQKLQAEEAREGERDEAARRVQFLQDLVQKARHLETARAAAERAASAASRSSLRQAAAKQKLDACLATIRDSTLELDKVRPTANTLEVVRAELMGLTGVGQRRQQQQKLSAELQTATHFAAQRTADRESLHVRYERTRKSVDDTESRWIEAQSFVLAQRLIQGAPCPVCGSLEHPSPASTHLEVPTDRERKARRDELAAAESARDRAVAAERDAGIEVAKLSSQMAALDQELGEWASAPQAVYHQALRDKQLAFEAADKARRRAAELDRLIESSRDAEGVLQKDFDAADSDLRQAQLASEQSKAIAEERAGNVPPEYRNPSLLDRALTEASTVAQQLKVALDNARRQVSEATQHLSAARARAEYAAARAAENCEHAQAARSRFEAALAAAGFDHEAAYRAAIRSAAQIAALDNEIRRYHGNLKAAEERLRRARDHADGVQQPDIGALEAAVAQCQADLEHALKRQTEIEGEIAGCEKWLAQLATIAAELQAAEKRYGIVSTLAHAATGGNDRRITLQRFVQVTLLERVLDSATVRLQAMSNGRYWLRIAQDVENRRSAAGLDLEVLDAHTGQARRVSTLSGGESFLASLSLALGLSDVVQSYAGGYHLESIFVDEGFGALDPEALDLALSTLRNLQHGGRLVGIISHVPELKQQIDVRLDVVTQKRGSTATFTVPGNGSIPEPVTVSD